MKAGEKIEEMEAKLLGHNLGSDYIHHWPSPSRSEAAIKLDNLSVKMPDLRAAIPKQIESERVHLNSKRLAIERQF